MWVQLREILMSQVAINMVHLKLYAVYNKVRINKSSLTYIQLPKDLQEIPPIYE